MHNKPETLGCIIKAARENAGITIEALADKANILSDTYIESRTKARSRVSMSYISSSGN